MRRIVVLSALVIVLILLAVAQLVLPGIAADGLRSRLSRYGQVESVHVSAFPAIELLWHHADRVRIAFASYRPAPGQAGTPLAQAGDAGTIDASAAEVDIGLLHLRDATLHVGDGHISTAARVSESDLRAAVPFLDGVVPVGGSGDGITLQGTATFLGATASVDATVAARGGALLIAPDVPFGGLATLTLFSDPHVAVSTVATAPSAGGFTVSATGYLR